MTHSKNNSLVLTVLVVLVADAASFKEVMSGGVHYDASNNPCTTNWHNRSATNDFSQCPTTASEIVESLFANGILLRLIPLIIGFLAFIPISCVVLICRYRYQRCGGSRMRPGGFYLPGDATFDSIPNADIIDKYYSFRSTIVVKILTVIPMFMGVVAVGLTAKGASDLSDGLDGVLGDVASGWDFFIDIGEYTLGNITNPDNLSDLPFGYNAEVFYGYIDDMKSSKNITLDEVNFIKQTVTRYAVYPSYVTGIPAVVMMLSGVAALLNIRIILPLFIIIASFFLQFVYFALASGILAAMAPVDILCDEIAIASNPHMKGIVNWQVIPECERRYPFQDIIDQLYVMENETSQEVCSLLTEVCDTTLSWSPFTNAQKVFMCNVTSGSQCQTFETVAGTVSSMFIKPAVITFSLFGATFETCGGHYEGCTLRVCATSCDRSEVRSVSQMAVRALDALVRVKYSLTTILFPWLNCTKIALKILDSGPTQTCAVTKGALRMTKDGSIVCAVALLVTIVICFLGQKRFACPSLFPLPKGVTLYLDIEMGTIVIRDESPNDNSSGESHEPIEGHHNPLSVVTPAADCNPKASFFDSVSTEFLLDEGGILSISSNHNVGDGVASGGEEDIESIVVDLPLMPPTGVKLSVFSPQQVPLNDSQEFEFEEL